MSGVGWVQRSLKAYTHVNPHATQTKTPPPNQKPTLQLPPRPRQLLPRRRQLRAQRRHRGIRLPARRPQPGQLALLPRAALLGRREVLLGRLQRGARVRAAIVVIIQPAPPQRVQLALLLCGARLRVCQRGLERGAAGAGNRRLAVELLDRALARRQGVLQLADRAVFRLEGGLPV